MRPIRQGDGTGISDVRLGDGTQIGEVRKGDGTVLWSAGPDIPDSVVVDDFERASLSPSGEYSGDTASFAIDTSGTGVTNGSNSLRKESTASAGDAVISTSGFPDYPAKGDRYVVDATIDGDGVPQIQYYVEDSNNFYYTGYNVSNNEIQFGKIVSGSFTAIETVSVDVSANTQYQYHTVPGDGVDDHVISLLDSDGNQLVILSATDGDISGSGIGFRDGDTNATTAWFDYARVGNNPQTLFEFVKNSETQEISGTRHYSRPHIEELDNGTWVMVYRDAADHTAVDDSQFNIRFSDDDGATWTADNTALSGASVAGAPFVNPSGDGVSDAIVFKTPSGDLLIHILEQDPSTDTRQGTRQYRSTDSGETWADEGRITPTGTGAPTTSEFLGGQDWTTNPATGEVFVSVFVDPSGNYTPPYYSGLGKTPDNGSTWEWVADITTTTLDTNEVGVACIGGSQLRAVMRDTQNTETYYAESSDNGDTWTSSTDISDVTGVVQRPRLTTTGEIDNGSLAPEEGDLYLHGRNLIGTQDKRTAMWASGTGGDSWTAVFDFDTGFRDGAYTTIQRDSGSGDVALFTYRGDLTDSDIYRYDINDRTW